MRRKMSAVAALGVFVGVAVLLGSGADAGQRRTPRVHRVAFDESFTVSGQFIGGLSGTVVLNGQAYELGKKTVIRELGRTGALPLGTFVSGGHVTLSGVQRGGSRLVRYVTIRPGAGANHGLEPSRNVGVLDSQAPR